jgi:chemotaxis family two-component system response regulator Rcp1
MASGSPTNAGTSGQRVRIMLVEDNPDDVFWLEQALQSSHFLYELIKYEDGEEAMRALSADWAPAPDLILVDLNLPRRDGFDVLLAIRQNPQLVGVPVGVLTSSDARKDRHRTALIGVARYIPKPPALDEFIYEVGHAVVELLAFGPRRKGLG